MRGGPYTYPPRGLSRDAAARYIGIGTSKFDQLVADGRMPKPIRVDGRVIWDRIKLDIAFGDLDQVAAGNLENEWDTARHADEINAARAGLEPERGPSGYPILRDPNHPLKKHYDRLGFDPKTMDRSDMERLQAEAHRRWQAELILTPLSKRERDTLRQFQSIEPGRLVAFNSIKGLGINTAECLETRGFIEIRFVTRDPKRLEGWVLTPKGKEAAQEVVAGREPARPAR